MHDYVDAFEVSVNGNLCAGLLTKSRGLRELPRLTVPPDPFGFNCLISGSSFPRPLNRSKGYAGFCRYRPVR